MILSINLLEKIIILNSLPTSGSLREMRTIRNINKTFPLSEEEKKECGVQINSDNTFQYNSNALIRREYNISEEELLILKEMTYIWDDKKQVNEFNFDLCEQIESL